MMETINAEIISIGSELLAGITINTNAAYLARKLQSIGIETKWITVIADEHKEILAALKRAKNRARVVICTGGLGPTPDDITKQVLCEFFQVKMAFNAQVFEDVQNFLNHRKIALNEVNRQQAVIPQCDYVLRNQRGTAPGLYFIKEEKHFFFLPGVPGEVYHLTEKDIVPILKKQLNLTTITTHLLRTTGIPESKLIDKIGHLVEQNKQFQLAFLPRFRGVDLRFTLPPGQDRNLNKFYDFIDIFSWWS